VLKKHYVVLVTILAFALAISACATTAEEAAPVAEEETTVMEEEAPVAEEAAAEDTTVESKGTIYAIFKDSSSVFFADMGKGAKKAAGELGYELVIQNPASEAEVDKQISLVEDAIAAKPVGIVLSVINSEALTIATEQVKNNGIPLTCADNGDSGGYCDALYATDNVQVGVDLAEKAAELLNDSGTVWYLSPLAGVQCVNDREEGFRTTMAEKYPNIEIVNKDYEYCDNDKTVCANRTLDLLTSRNDDIDLIVGANENALIGVATAIDERGLAGKVLVIGLDASDDVIAYIKQGVIQASAIQNPFNMGYMAVYGIQEMIDGKDLGHAYVDSGNWMVTADNVDDPDVQAILHPE
jgi:ribose transport system substrate-binding protein